MRFKVIVEEIGKHVKKMCKGKQLIAGILFLVSMFLIFPSGILLTSTKFEQYGLNAANFAKNNTTNGDYISLLVTSNESQKMPTGFFEAHEMNGIFRGDNFNFSTTVNSDKKQKIRIPELSDDINFSVLYANTFSNREYEDHYRHEYYPLELMFKGDHSVDKSDYSFCYISTSQADILLEKMSLEKNIDNYQKLIRTKIDIEYDGIACNYSIANIYLEVNSFYTGLKSTMENFVVTYSKHPDNFKQAYNYYLNTQSFQNTYLLKRIASIYDATTYSISLSYVNITNSFDSQTITDFFNVGNAKSYEPLSIIFIVITFLIFIASIAIFFIKKIIIGIEDIFLYASFGLLPHLLFRLIYVFTQSVYCFSSFSTVSFFVMEILLVSSLSILHIIQRRERLHE